MNKTKIIIASLAISVLGLSGLARSDWGFGGTTSRGGLYVTYVTTHAQIFSGPGVLYEVQLPTGTAEEFAVAFDTAARGTGVNLGMFTTTQTVSVQMTFQSTTTVTNGALSNVGSVRFGGDRGVGIGNGLFLFNPNGKTISTFWGR